MKKSYALFAVLAFFVLPSCAHSEEIKFNSPDDKKTMMFKPKGPGKVVLSGKWEGSAKSLEVGLFSPTQWMAYWRGNVVNKSFELSWDFKEKDLDEAGNRAWKIVMKARGGDAAGDVEITGSAIDPESADPSANASDGGSKPASSPSQAGKKGNDDVGMMPSLSPARLGGKEEVPAIALDDFGQRVRRAFLETPYYKPWVEKVTSNKKNARLDIRPLGLTVTPSVRKLQTRYGSISLTIRNVTLTPAQNVNLTESVSGSVETKIELLLRVELPGWHLLAIEMSPFEAYPGEPARITAVQVETKSLSRGEVAPPTSYPFSASETFLLIPILLSQPGEYLVTCQPIAREPTEILFILSSIELYRLSS